MCIVYQNVAKRFSNYVLFSFRKWKKLWNCFQFDPKPQKNKKVLQLCTLFILCSFECYLGFCMSKKLNIMYWRRKIYFFTLTNHRSCHKHVLHYVLWVDYFLCWIYPSRERRGLSDSIFFQMKGSNKWTCRSMKLLTAYVICHNLL